MLIKAFSKSQPLKIQQVTEILSQGIKLLKKLPNIIEENVPQGKQITIIGDLHGQFFDLLEIFKRNGMPSNENPYLFLGNYVDYSLFGSEIFLLLLCYKLAYPQSIHLLRGNHESAVYTKLYGFKIEVEDKYNPSVYQNFLLVFNTLPICAIVNFRVFIVHGGLFNQRNVTLKEIRQINRFNEPGEEGGEYLMEQMLCSNPMEQPGYKNINPLNILLQYPENTIHPIVKIRFFDLDNLPNQYGVDRAQIGIPHYMAPEIYLENKKFSQKADVWSVGVIFYQLLSGQMIQQLPPRLNKITLPCWDIIVGMLNPSPERRLSCNA
ncbi:MAG: putative Serine/threonine-protein phosphatase 5 [Streblomastix strix]|uniref:Serine/threonine-protein phosphatase n=1 Tax=Streblomastix strix TaxID=222440 RepID=A0A5J4W3U7_9EUKA|nr:MAG: putative Serine/threonine-protein phosphatase 5 [Streblomastix strix]